MLSQLDSYYGDILFFEQQKSDAGLGLSDASIGRIIESCESYLIDPEDNFLTETFESRLKFLEHEITLTEQQKTDFRSRHLDMIKTRFCRLSPSDRRAFSLKGRGINESGLARFRDGKQYYEYLVRSGPGLSYRTIEELKTALSYRMQKIWRRSPLFQSCRFRSHFSCTQSDQILTDLQDQMNSDFPALSDAARQYEIRYVPAQLEAALSPAFYLTAPLDDPLRM